jgi:hypothetical protein
MVKESWSDDKKACEEKKFREIQAERVRQYNRLRNTPKYIVCTVTTRFDPEPYDFVTMQNGDKYEGRRKDLGDHIVRLVQMEVEEILGLNSPGFIFSFFHTQIAL